jgi:hypothetical protein
MRTLRSNTGVGKGWQATGLAKMTMVHFVTFLLAGLDPEATDSAE